LAARLETAELERKRLTAPSPLDKAAITAIQDVGARYRRLVMDLENSIAKQPERARQLLSKLIGKIQIVPVGDQVFAELDTGPKLPPEIVELRALCRHYTREAVEAIVLVMTNPSTPGSARVTAAALLLDRAWGRATATIEHSVTVPVPAPPDYDKLIAAFNDKY